MTLAIRLEVENVGLLHAEDVRIGLVGWITPPRKNHEAAVPSLLAYVEARAPEEYEAQTPQLPWFLAHVGANRHGFELRPFEAPGQRFQGDRREREDVAAGVGSAATSVDDEWARPIWLAPRRVARCPGALRGGAPLEGVAKDRPGAG